MRRMIQLLDRFFGRRKTRAAEDDDRDTNAQVPDDGIQDEFRLPQGFRSRSMRTN